MPAGVLWATGCNTSLSNDHLLDDVDFLDALPGTEQFDLDYPGDWEVTTCEAVVEGESTLACVTVSSLTNAESVLEIVSDTNDLIRTLTPTRREEDYREWGPGTLFPELPEVFVRVRMSRSPTRSAYTWWYALAPTVDGPWTEEVLKGTHYAGDETVAEGEGTLAVDLDGWSSVTGASDSGRLNYAYDIRGLPWFSVATEDWSSASWSMTDQTWSYQAAEDGGGDFHYASQLDVLEGTELDDLELRVRWTAEGLGRGDALIFGGEVTGKTGSASECWEPDGGLVWHSDDVDWMDDFGAVEDCAFQQSSFGG